MKRVWVSVLLLFFALSFSVSAVPVSAQTPDVTIFPMQKLVSVDSSFLVKVDPKTTEKPIRITWSVYDTGNEGIGSLPIVDGKGLCYFSNDDGNATCGPSPFSKIGETEFYVYVITPTQTTNKTTPLNVSSLTIPTKDVNRVDNTVYMYFYMGEKDLMKYTIYKEDLTIYQSDRPLEYDLADGRYEGNITLNAGVYYFAFIVTDGQMHGTALKRIEIPSGDFLTIQTDKDEYWKGEEIKITGTTNAESVTGQVDFPNGTKAKDFSTDVEGDNTFSHEFSAMSNWPEGEYEVKTSHPLVRSVEFSITEFFDITPESVSGSVNKSGDFTASVSVKNLRSNSTNISLSTGGDMEDDYVTVSDTQLSPQETVTIAITITNVQTDVDGTITLETPEGLQLGIPVSVTVTETAGPVCPPTEKALEIDKDFLVWSQECVAGDEISYELLVINNGDSALSDFEYDVEDTFMSEQSLESLESYGNIDVLVYDFSVDPGESEFLEIGITTESAGKHQGVITIRSGGDYAYLFVDLECFEDLSGDPESLDSRLSDLNLGADALEDVNSDISDAQEYFSLGNYRLADEYYGKAKAKIEVLEEGGVSPPPMDFTWVIVVVVVIMVVLVAVWFFKFKKPQISEYEEETEGLEGFE